MRALSYRDPWGWLVAKGIKPVDNRPWSTTFRGRIYIHVSKTFDYEGFVYIYTHHEVARTIHDIDAWQYLNLIRRDKPNAGKIIGEVDVVDCVTRYDSPWFFGPYGLLHRNAQLYPRGIPCRGRVFPHLFDPGPEVEAEVAKMKAEVGIA